jgi:large subunit ribosomal protein L10
MPEGYSVKVRPEKVGTVERIKTQLGETPTAVLTEYRGLTVPQLKELRTKLRDQDTSYRVEKNTLARRAVTELGYGELDALFVGPVAVAYVKGDPVAAAKVLATFAREHPDLVIKGGVLEGRVITADEAKGLATIDVLDVSRAKIAGLLTAALRQIAMLAEAPARQILYVLEQIGLRASETAAPVEASAEAAAAEAEPAGEQPAEPEAAQPAQPTEQAEEEEPKEGE